MVLVPDMLNKPFETVETSSVILYSDIIKYLFFLYEPVAAGGDTWWPVTLPLTFLLCSVFQARQVLGDNFCQSEFTAWPLTQKFGLISWTWHHFLCFSSSVRAGQPVRFTATRRRSRFSPRQTAVRSGSVIFKLWAPSRCELNQNLGFFSHFHRLIQVLTAEEQQTLQHGGFVQFSCSFWCKW